MTANGCLRVGQQAPDFTATAVVDQEFKDITLSQYRGKYVVLFFYPLDFTFVCPTEITAFSDRYADFSSKNTEVLGVSVDASSATWPGFRPPATKADWVTLLTLWLLTSRKRSLRPTTSLTMLRVSHFAVCSSSIPMV